MWSEVGAKSSRAGQSTEYHYHEQEDTEMTTTTTTSSSSTFPPDMLREHRRIQWAEKNYLFEKRKGFPSTLGPTSKSDGTGYSEPPLHKHGVGVSLSLIYKAALMFASSMVCSVIIRERRANRSQSSIQRIMRKRLSMLMMLVNSLSMVCE